MEHIECLEMWLIEINENPEQTELWRDGADRGGRGQRITVLPLLTALIARVEHVSITLPDGRFRDCCNYIL
jgi:hypothetical protein